MIRAPINQKFGNALARPHMPNQISNFKFQIPVDFQDSGDFKSEIYS